MAEGDTDAEFDSFTLRRSGRLVTHASETDEQEAGETPATIKRMPRGKGNKDAIESRRMELEYELEKQKIIAEGERVNDVNYKVNVKGRRGIVIYHVNLVKAYNRRVMMATVATPDDRNVSENDNESYKDVHIGQSLLYKQRKEILDLCEEFKDILTSKPGRTDLIEHSIRTTTEKPITLKPYRIPHALRGEV